MGSRVSPFMGGKDLVMSQEKRKGRKPTVLGTEKQINNLLGVVERQREHLQINETKLATLRILLEQLIVSERANRDELVKQLEKKKALVADLQSKING